MSHTPSEQIVAILGATGGIGRAVSKRLAAAGYGLCLGARSAEELEPLAGELGARAVPTDARDFESIDRFFAEAAEAGPLAAVVHAVGSLLLKPAHITTAQEFDATIATNLTSAFGVVRAAGRALRSSGGSVVLFSSAAAEVGLPNHEAIAAAKGGVSGLVRSAAATYARSGIRFNAIAPGLVETPMTERIVGNERALESSMQLHAIRRPGRPDEIAGLVEWLVGPDSTWMSGQILSLDGGLAHLKA